MCIFRECNFSRISVHIMRILYSSRKSEAQQFIAEAEGEAEAEIVTIYVFQEYGCLQTDNI